MVLIAIDKHSRKILGYICRNNQNVAYCCSECDVEFTTAKDLEQHMVIHENHLLITTPQPRQKNTNEVREDETSLTISSGFEKEKQLKIKYQVTPCTVQLLRFDNDNDEMNLGGPADNSLNQENIAPLKKSPPKKRPSTTTFTQPISPIFVKRQKKTAKHIKKMIKQKVPNVTAVCFLCGEKFQSTFALHQHEKTHLENGIYKPVFPCKVCGKNVKNMKIHLRQHKIETKKTISMSSKETNTTEEASSSTDAVFTKTVPTKEPENGITSNETITESPDPTTLNTCDEEFIIAPISNEATSSLCDNEGHLNKVDDSSTLNNDAFKSLETIKNDLDQSVNTGLDSQLEYLSNQNGFEDIENGQYDDMAIAKTENAKESFNCSICPRNFPSQLKLDRHKALHDRKVPCEMCGKLVAMSYKRVHMKKYHIADSIDFIPLETL